MILAVVFVAHTKAQELSTIADTFFIKTTGGINAGLSAYTVHGMERRQDPFSYLVNANLNFNISDIISMPFSATLCNGSKTYNQPSFYQFGMSPTYKSITLHGGYRNMRFSKYTLNGISYLGGGVEVNPPEGYVRFKAVYGRLAKGIPFQDNIQGKIELPSYARWGWGSMLTLGTSDNFVDLIIFKASDNPRSVNIPDSLLIQPKENLVLGFNTQLKLLKVISIKTEYAFSAFTEDTRMPEIVYDRYTYLNNLGGLFTPRESSNLSKAFSMNLGYTHEVFSLGFSFENVAPDYKTLGSSYFSNDFRNYLFNASVSLMQNKITLSGSYGVQQNNLSKEKEETTKRIIGSVQAIYSISDRLNVSANYSNFTTNTTPSVVYLVDSVKMVQVAQNVGGTVNYTLPGKTVQQSVSVSANLQYSDLLNNMATEVVESNTKSNVFVFSYTASHDPTKLTASASYNMMTFGTADQQTRSHGPTLNLQRPFLNNKIRSGLSCTLMNSKTNDQSSKTTVLRFTNSYSPIKKHTVQFNLSYSRMNRPDMSEQTEEGDPPHIVSGELRAALNYSVNF